MTATEAATLLATLSAALTALVALTCSGCWRLSRGLTALLWLSAACDGVMLARPSLWTPEFWSAREAGIALLASIGILELGREILRPATRIWLAVCRRAALILVPVALMGAWGLLTLDGVQRAGYRGLVIVDAAVAALAALVLSAVSLYELPRHPLTTTALRGLLAYFAIEVVYLGSWEASRRLAELLAWPATLTFVWASLSIARDAFSSSPRLGLLPAGANR